ncbi:MFS transporter [Flectobacillus major]|uniref:MFS transporter n=1 Tax=Flectobacillus major TaxID=103 RepID=UPI00040E7932|nr:MFS transporter [Flectobacillus major]
MIDKRVLPLAIGGLGIGTTEFSIMGLLPDIARSMNVTIPEAGHFISAYALGVVVGAPLLIGYSVKYPPKKVLLALMILFTLFNGLSAITSNYTNMMIARFLSGLPHGAFFGVGTVVASQLAGKGKEARYISLMFSGLTIANLAMVPLVTFVGHTFGWRWYFIIVTLIGLITLLSLYWWLPNIKSQQKASIQEELRFLKNGQFWYVFLLASIGFGGLFAWFSYITPLMTIVAGFSPQTMAYIMVLAGSGMVVGNLIGGFLADNMGATKTTAWLLFAMMIALTCVFLFSSYKIPALFLTFVCGGLSMSTAAPVNIMMMKASPGSEMMGAAFMQAAFNIANSAGAFLGGIPLEYGYSYNYPSLVGVGMTLIGLAICTSFFLKYNSPKLIKT